MRFARWFFVLLLLGAANAALAAAEPEDAASVEIEAAVGLYNKYIWRGYDLGGEADYLVQAEANASIAGFTLGVWGNYNEASDKLDEIDLCLEYGHDFTEQVAARIGHIYYAVEDSADSAEIYAGTTISLPVDVDVDLFYDYDEAETWFLSAGISKTFEPAEDLGLNLGTAFGYFDFDYLNQAELTASLDYAATEAFTVSPSFLYSVPLSQTAEDAGVDDEFVAAVTLTYSF